jgi:hypothetical protein
MMLSMVLILVVVVLTSSLGLYILAGRNSQAGTPWGGAITVSIERVQLENETEAILTEYENLVKERPDRQFFLINIDGILAIGKEPCADCVIMTDFMSNGTVSY